MLGLFGQNCFRWFNLWSLFPFISFPFIFHFNEAILTLVGKLSHSRWQWPSLIFKQLYCCWWFWELETQISRIRRAQGNKTSHCRKCWTSVDEVCRQRCRLNICSYISWIISIIYNYIHLQLLRRQCCLEVWTCARWGGWTNWEICCQFYY